MTKQRFEVRQYRRHMAGYVAQWFKIVDTKTGETVRTGITNEPEALAIAKGLVALKTTK